jgi:hypothetical protein
MAVIKRSLIYMGTTGEKCLCSLFDIDKKLSWINAELVKGLSELTNMGRSRFVSINNSDDFIEIKERISLEFYLNDVLLSDEFLVVPGLSEEAIIGAATMQKWRIKLDFEHDTVHVDPKVAKMQLI